ncbi:MAG: hypothetical protein IT323_10805 [Anaerolineae bacterium]|nr:hypothetical protein [Anaerolineae bacterium]
MDKPNPDDLQAVDNLLFALVKGGGEMVGTYLKRLYDEGREFAGDPASARWQVLLKEQPLFKAASILWSLAGMDSMVLSAREPESRADSRPGGGARP